jgi:catechol 2,3-dioxygenase-like lactoylglutathione lyase family enzyme
VNVEFVAGFAAIVRDTGASRALYADTLGIEFQDDGGYLHTGGLDGVKHLGLWPLEQAAQACFGTSTWPDGVTVPQATLEFEVDDVAGAAAELEAQGYELIHSPRTEPWGQTIARVLDPNGLLIGVCHTPALH